MTRIVCVYVWLKGSKSNPIQFNSMNPQKLLQWSSLVKIKTKYIHRRAIEIEAGNGWFIHSGIHFISIVVVSNAYTVLSTRIYIHTDIALSTTISFAKFISILSFSDFIYDMMPWPVQIVCLQYSFVHIHSLFLTLSSLCPPPFAHTYVYTSICSLTS